MAPVTGAPAKGIGWWLDKINSRVAMLYRGTVVAHLTATAITLIKNTTVNGTLTVDGASTLTGAITASGGVAATGALSATTTVTAGTGLVATTGGVNVVAGNLTLSAGRIREVLSVVDVDATNATIPTTTMLAGILVHTSVTGVGTLTTETAANIIAGVGGIPLTADGQCVTMYYINDGTQVVTLTAGDGSVTLTDAGQTIAADEACILIFRRTSATTVRVFSIGA